MRFKGSGLWVKDEKDPKFSLKNAYHPKQLPI